jgi:dTDP-4-dehydrorhamnose reductase
MLGNALFRYLAADSDLSVTGTIRSSHAPRELQESGRILHGVHAEDNDSLTYAFSESAPDIVINCVGVIKQLQESNEPLVVLPINSILPHRLSRLCRVGKARLIHISTDCVFTGDKGNYGEDDHADADDLYGQTKHLGEVHDSHAITLRTSIIGHGLRAGPGLVDWFLSSSGTVGGYSRAIFSGLPTVELARVIRHFVIPRPHLNGLYHVSADPISKYELLKLVAQVYNHAVDIEENPKVVIDRSLNSERFRTATGYAPPSWPELVRVMEVDYRKATAVIARA